MATTSSPFFINSSSPAPFAGPAAALYKEFYPDVSPAVVPQLIILSGLLAVYLVVNVANIVIRWRRTSVHVVSIRDGHVVWSTSIVHCFFLLIFLAGCQAQIWLLVRRWRDGGRYDGIYVARGVSWSALIVAAAFHVLGLALATGFSTSTTDTGAPGSLSSAPIARRIYNVASVLGPLSFGGASLAPQIAAEFVCRKQFNTFVDALDIARDGDAAAAAGENITAFEDRWSQSLVEIDDSKCEAVQRISYWALMAALIILIIAGSVFYWILSGKLARQAALLRRSVKRYRYVELAGLSSKDAPRDGSVTPNRGHRAALPSVPTVYSEATHKSQLSRSRSDSSHTLGKLGVPVSPFPYSRSPTPVAMLAATEDARAEARAESLEAGLCNLRSQFACLLLAAAQYLANTTIILVRGAAVQSNPFWTAWVNLWALWIYGACAGPACLILLIVGLDESRQSLLGIPFQTFRAPIYPTPSSEADDDVSDVVETLRYGRPLSHLPPYREEAGGARQQRTVLPDIREGQEMTIPRVMLTAGPRQTGLLRPMDNF